MTAQSNTKIWGHSDNGSTSALQAESRGSIPRDSTKYASHSLMERDAADNRGQQGSIPWTSTTHQMGLLVYVGNHTATENFDKAELRQFESG